MHSRIKESAVKELEYRLSCYDNHEFSHSQMFQKAKFKVGKLRTRGLSPLDELREDLKFIAG